MNLIKTSFSPTLLIDFYWVQIQNLYLLYKNFHLAKVLRPRPGCIIYFSVIQFEFVSRNPVVQAIHENARVSGRTERIFEKWPLKSLFNFSRALTATTALLSQFKRANGNGDLAMATIFIDLVGWLVGRPVVGHRVQLVQSRQRDFRSHRRLSPTLFACLIFVMEFH